MISLECFFTVFKRVKVSLRKPLSYQCFCAHSLRFLAKTRVMQWLRWRLYSFRWFSLMFGCFIFFFFFIPYLVSIYNTNRTINYYTSNYYSINYYSNKLLISLIQIDGCCNLEKKISVSVSLLVLSDFIPSTFCIPHRGQSVSLVCKPNQITEVCVIPMIQKVSNCGKY